MLLASHGFDAEKHARQLSAIDLKTTFEPLEPIGDTDVQQFLQHEHEMLIITAIEEAKKATQEQFDEAFLRSMQSEWDADKREILQAIAQRRVLGDLSLPSTTATASFVEVRAAHWFGPPCDAVE